MLESTSLSILNKKIVDVRTHDDKFTIVLEDGVEINFGTKLEPCADGQVLQWTVVRLNGDELWRCL